MKVESQENKALQEASRILSERLMSTQELKQRLLAKYNQDEHCDEIVGHTIHLRAREAAIKKLAIIKADTCYQVAKQLVIPKDE